MNLADPAPAAVAKNIKSNERRGDMFCGDGMMGFECHEKDHGN